MSFLEKLRRLFGPADKQPEHAGRPRQAPDVPPGNPREVAGAAEPEHYPDGPDRPR